MPEAPPRRQSRSEMPAARKSSLSKVPKLEDDRDFEVPKESTADRIVGLSDLRRSQRSRMGVVVSLMVIVGVGLAVFAFKDVIKLGTDGKVPIIVNVTTTPTTKLYVKHKGDAQPLELGDVPYRGAGVFVGDTLMMVNLDQGINYEQDIPFGEPGKEQIIEKKFFQADIKVTTTPRVDAARCPIQIYRNGQKLGAVGLKLSLYEGVQNLELRGDCLKDAVPFKVPIDPSVKTPKGDAKVVDVTIEGHKI
jgi:hypothetical protein